jgi:hypothetical protein
MFFTSVCNWMFYAVPTPLHSYTDITWWRQNYELRNFTRRSIASSLLQFNFLITLTLNPLNLHYFLNVWHKVSDTHKQNVTLHIAYLNHHWFIQGTKEVKYTLARAEAQHNMHRNGKIDDNSYKRINFCHITMQCIGTNTEQVFPHQLLKILLFLYMKQYLLWWLPSGHDYINLRYLSLDSYWWYNLTKHTFAAI